MSLNSHLTKSALIVRHANHCVKPTVSYTLYDFNN